MINGMHCLRESVRAITVDKQGSNFFILWRLDILLRPGMLQFTISHKADGNCVSEVKGYGKPLDHIFPQHHTVIVHSSCREKESPPELQFVGSRIEWN